MTKKFTLVGETDRKRHVLEDVPRLATTLGVNLPDRIDSWEQLDALHERLIDLQISKKQEENDLSYKYTYSVPYEGNDHITPLLNRGELEKEGRKMRHCVGSYHDLCACGQSAIYHVQMGKEEATLELRRESVGDDWRVEQFYGPCNKRPAGGLAELVKDWLERSRG